jgi:hypothetical protein
MGSSERQIFLSKGFIGKYVQPLELAPARTGWLKGGRLKAGLRECKKATDAVAFGVSVLLVEVDLYPV